MSNQIYDTVWLIQSLSEQILGIHQENPLLSRTEYMNDYLNALVFRGEMSITNYTDSGSVSKGVYFQIIITERHNIFVKWVTDHHERTNIKNLEDFQNISNHDDCWKSSLDGWFHDKFFRICSIVNDNIAPRDLDLRVQLGGFIGHNPLMFAQVKFKNKNDNHYEKVLTEVTCKDVTISWKEQ